MNIQPTINQVRYFLYKNSPTLYTGIAVGGVFTTIVLTSKVAPIAADWIASETVGGRKIKFMDYIRIGGRIYLPVIISGTITIFCIIMSNKINMQRQAALLSLYTLAEVAAKEYKDKVAEMIGEKKELKIREALDQDKLDKNPVDTKEVILTGHGEYLFFDTLSGRYFRSEYEAVRKAQNDYNHELMLEGYSPLNDFYDMLGLEATEMGRTMGWSVDYGLMEIRFSAKIAKGGEPCIVIDYEPKVRYL